MKMPPLTDNEKAANGPLPGDLSLYEKELRGCESLKTPGYYPSLNGAEIADSRRSGLFPFATFGGSFDGPNRVYAWRSEDEYLGTTFLCNRRPGELYLCGGNLPEAKPPVYPGPYIAKADATTGKQIWRTYLENANVSPVWIGVNNLNILANGNIATSWSNRIALIDGDTGQILKYNTLPTGTTPEGDASFKHLTIAPDGTLILKDQTRPTGITEQGSKAMFTGLKKGLKQGNSVLVAVHPDTLEVLHWLQLPEPATTPHGIDMFDGRIAIYISADVHAFRYFWNPATTKLSPDESWVVPYLEKGQTTGDAPGILGEWITILTNGTGSKTVASSVVAIHTQDAEQEDVGVPVRTVEADPDEPGSAQDQRRSGQQHGLRRGRGGGKGGRHQARPAHRRDENRLRRGRLHLRLPADDRTERKAGFDPVEHEAHCPCGPAPGGVRDGQVQGTGDVAGCRHRQNPRRIGLLRAALPRFSHRPGLRRPRVLPDEQRIPHAAGAFRQRSQPRRRSTQWTWKK